MKKDPFRVIEEYPDNALEAPFEYVIVEKEEGHSKCGTEECCGKCKTAKKIKDLQENGKKVQIIEKSP
jgi:hypothetical protein